MAKEIRGEGDNFWEEREGKTIIWPAGQVLTFYDFDSSRPASQRGRLKSWADAEGNLTETVYHTSDGKPARKRGGRV